jgi:hypothetical protein
MTRTLANGSGKEEEVVAVVDCTEKLSINEKFNECSNM